MTASPATPGTAQNEIWDLCDVRRYRVLEGQLVFVEHAQSNTPNIASRTIHGAKMCQVNRSNSNLSPVVMDPKKNIMGLNDRILCNIT